VGCDSVAKLSLTVNPSPIVNLSAGDTNIIIGDTTMILAVITGPYSGYIWAAPGISSNSPLSFIVNPTTATTYVLQVTSPANCIAVREVTVNVFAQLRLPNAFTPNNGDTLNNVFRVPPGMYINLTDFSIYDRWGLKVFETNDIHQGWDGTYRGTDQPIGGYVYVIKGYDIRGKAVLYKGSISLIR
jgi:gliding motility-associated-like protein